MRRTAYAVCALALAAGCYSDRLTGGYDNTPDGNGVEAENAVLEEAGQDEASQKARIEKLEKIAAAADIVYLLDAGDSISVSVYGHPDLSMTTKVSPDGCIGMPFLGQLKVGGHTIKDATETIRAGLEPYIKHPVVSITVNGVSSETVTIGGACARPGLYNITDTSRVADLYAMAGGSAVRLFNGVDTDAADLENSLFVREGELIPIDFQKAIVGDPLHNIKLRKGDYVFIAQRMESSITICGEVMSPHKRLYEPGTGLIESLTAAGWMKESHWSHVIIIRNGLSDPKMYKVDVDGILAGKCRNVLLRPNDIVYVPRDNLAEYNVFIRKLLPTAQLVNLLTARFSTVTL